MASLPLYLALALVGCTKDAETDDSAVDSDVGPEAVCTEPETVECVDALILGLSLHDSISEGLVTTSADGDDFVTVVDATAGGYSAASQNPWVYLKFTESGAEKVDIDDEDALESMEWHMAFHRFKIRINSGSGGPSCVGVSPFLDSSYADIVEVGDPNYYQDDFMTPPPANENEKGCELITDSYGLGSPQVAMSSWWSYNTCVATTGVPFLVQLDDGHVLKLVVEAYYESGQEDCNSSDVKGTNSGMLSLRWQMME